MGERRYIVEWHPLAEIEAECRKLGMKDGDDTSFWDWVHPENVSRHRECAYFREAVRLAKRLLKDNCFGDIRIYRQRCTFEAGDDFHRRPQWDDECFWDVIACEIPDQAAPDYTYDMAEAA